MAEIGAATVPRGELSLASAIVADEWVSSHEKLGRDTLLTASLPHRGRSGRVRILPAASHTAVNA